MDETDHTNGSGNSLESRPLRESALERRKEKARRKGFSRVGCTIRETAARRLSCYVLCVEFLVVLFATGLRTDGPPELGPMLMLHHLHAANSTRVTRAHVGKSLDLARASALPGLYQYDCLGGCFGLRDGAFVWQRPFQCAPPERAYPWQTFEVTVTHAGCGTAARCTTAGRFLRTTVLFWQSVRVLLTALVAAALWIAFRARLTGSVRTLVVKPIEAMIQLLSILSQDPVGYQDTAAYQSFLAYERESQERSAWSKEVMEGMETYFLMNTIKTIGSLLEVGFGSAGVEIIRNNLEKSKSKSNKIYFSQSGIPVECIFLFCDIRQFTDTTEILNEEIFLFTNKVAVVVHSICHSLAGSANKNIGDAFLISWKRSGKGASGAALPSPTAGEWEGEDDPLKFQADKALLSVIRIAIALYDEQFYLESVSSGKRRALQDKLKQSSGSLVKLGFGLHAGVAVQGAIGSVKKIDATYISEHVDMAETLESTTKAYGVPMLLSNAFFHLLSDDRQEECRKIDELYERQDAERRGDTIELYTWDMDIENIWRAAVRQQKKAAADPERDRWWREGCSTIEPAERVRPPMKKAKSRSFVLQQRRDTDQALHLDRVQKTQADLTKMDELPNGVVPYDPGMWVDAKMALIRKKFDLEFFLNFDDALRSYTEGDWRHAKEEFAELIRRYQDGPSQHFMRLMEENNFLPPRNFTGFGQL